MNKPSGRLPLISGRMVVISHLQSITTIRPVSHYSTCVSEQLAQSHYMPQQLLSQQQCITVILANITLYLVTEMWCEQFAQSYYRAVEPISFDTHSAYDNSCNNVSLDIITTGHHLRTVQTIVENVYVWLVGPRHPVSEC